MSGPSAVDTFQDIEEGAEIAKKMASLVWAATEYRFVYKKKQQSKSAETVTTYTFHCAQNDKEVTKTRLVDDERKRRARMKMDRFPCEGYLHVTIDSATQGTARLRVQHHRAHCHYVDISVSPEITKLVEDMRNEPASNVGSKFLCQLLGIDIWTRVLQEHPHTEITQKQVYAMW
ncbi:hypothetical protein B0H11DRAFT_1791272, partial [Mycena galericulata]